ncbi:MAG: AraC family ligand binding domain-containing protein [Candidatus Nealsonbacteria bacterium DGGOD1a]|nr:MAG: AraC family ligand binding domain-containing protein [Candidatus Nealsonbacteria bacterium DGGOD1a]
MIETQSGHETTICQRECDFCYYILEGNGYFEINSGREDCTAGDLVVIPAGNKFTYKGKMKMLLNCTPPWCVEQEEMVG